MIGGWLAVLALAFAAFALAAFLLRLPREGFAVFGAALLFGLAGYGLQGSPGQPASPTERLADPSANGEEMVEARRSLFNPNRPKPDYLTISDGFARNGRFEQAAGLLRKGLSDNPGHLEGWLALGMALTGHADGQVTPAAAYAYGKARALDPESPAPDYFLGFSYLQSGQVRAARETWAGLVARSPEDAPWVPELTQRIAELDRMIANAPMLR